MSVPSADVADLLEKYRAIVRLRRHEEDAPITAMRALAKRYPGSLRELDELPMERLEEKLAELEAMTDGAKAPPWVGAQTRFHALVRGALVARRYVRDGTLPVTAAEHFRTWTDDPEAHLWATELAAIHRPPRGRLLDLVFARLERELSVDADEARRLVFTTERPRR